MKVTFADSGVCPRLAPKKLVFLVETKHDASSTRRRSNDTDGLRHMQRVKPMEIETLCHLVCYLIIRRFELKRGTDVLGTKH